MISKDDLKKLAAWTPRIEPVVVPEWDNQTLYVRTMNVLQREQWELEASKHKNVKAGLLVATVCNKDGSLYFTPEDVDFINSCESAPVNRLFDKAFELNKVKPEDVDFLEKN